MEQYVDLHTHSTYSDGSRSPADLVREARKAGLSAIALTDHDVLDGLPEARATGEVEEVTVISGVEISAASEFGEVHVLGLEVNTEQGSALQCALRDQRKAREKRAAEIIDKLHGLGMPLPIRDVKAIAGVGSIGRPHIAAGMVARGYVSTVEEAFARYLKEGAAAYAGRKALTTPEAIALIRGAGGFASIAHPVFIRTGGGGRLEEYLKGLVDCGLEGLECFTSAHDEGSTMACVGIAKRLDLIPTGGSDYHGDSKPAVRLGQTRGGQRIPYAILADIRNRLARRRTVAPS